MPKRTRTRESQDINQFAASIVAQVTGPKAPAPAQAVRLDLDDPEIRSQIMRAMGSGGTKGAATLNARLSPAQRKASAKRAAQARWGKK